MDFKQYQEKTTYFAFYPEDRAIEYLALGLVSEAGEVAGVVKKKLRDNSYIIEFEQKIVKELGDVMWYFAQLCYWLDLDFEEILETNISKLAERKKRNRLTGDGDDR